jgi:ATP-binding cassette subfamily F protein 3
MHSCDLLIDALNKYEGSIILVSHDRYFISKTANKIWEIVDHKIKEFKGGYEEWVAWKERMAKHEMERLKAVSQKEKEVKAESVRTAPVQKNQAAKEHNLPKNSSAPSPINKDSRKELQKLQKQFQQLEQKIAIVSEQKSKLEGSLADPGTYSDKNKFLQTESEYKKASEELSKLNTEYEKVFDLIVKLEPGT